MVHEEVLSILDKALLDFDATKGHEGIKNLLQAVFSAIEQHFDADDVPGVYSRIPQLMYLYSVQPDWYILESLIARATDSAFTACIDGMPHGISASPALEQLVLTSCSRWSRRLTVQSESLDIGIILKHSDWKPQSVSIIKNLIYTSENARTISRTFLESKASMNQPMSHLAPVIWSLLDAEGRNDVGSSRIWRKHMSKLAASIISTCAPRHHRVTCGRAIRAMVEKLPSLRSEFISDLLVCIKDTPKDTLTSEVLKLGKHLIKILPHEGNDFASTLLEHALNWIARSFVGSDTLDSDIVRALGAISSNQSPAYVNLSSESCEVFPQYQAASHRCCSYIVDSMSSL